MGFPLVYGENCTKYAEYAYDAWGNCTILQDTNGIGTLNPYRYRGYYWDSEINLYYLNARYYDPAIGRFISQDSIKYIAPLTLNGMNLFVYCLNNPVMGYDPNGTLNWGNVLDCFSTIMGLLNPVSKVTGLGAIIVAMCQGRWNDLQNDWDNGCFNPFNQDESVALSSKVFSFYKGESVVRHSIPKTTSCQIFGTIFLNTDTLNNADGIQTLNHEFGHGIQEKLFPGYLFAVAVPSLITYFSGVYGSAYYSMPWERTADYFGGVNRGPDYYKSGSLGWAFAENIFGPIVIPFYFIFGY